MRLGTADLEGIHTDGGIERRVKAVHWHPKYVYGRAYFDVGIAIASKPVSFTSYVRPICLPYLPVDYEDSFKDKFVTLSGWGYTRLINNCFSSNQCFVQGSRIFCAAS